MPLIVAVALWANASWRWWTIPFGVSYNTTFESPYAQPTCQVCLHCHGHQFIIKGALSLIRRLKIIAQKLGSFIWSVNFINANQRKTTLFIKRIIGLFQCQRQRSFTNQSTHRRKMGTETMMLQALYYRKKRMMTNREIRKNRKSRRNQTSRPKNKLQRSKPLKRSSLIPSISSTLIWIPKSMCSIFFARLVMAKSKCTMWLCNSF